MAAVTLIDLDDHIQIEQDEIIHVWDKRRISLLVNDENELIKINHLINPEEVVYAQFFPLDLGYGTLKAALDDIIPLLKYTEPAVVIDTSNYAKLDSENNWAESQYWGVDELTYGAAITWDVKTSPKAHLTLTGNCVVGIASSRIGATYILHVYQDGVGSHTLEITGAIQPASAGSVIAVTAAASSKDLLSIEIDKDGIAIVGMLADLG